MIQNKIVQLLLFVASLVLVAALSAGIAFTKGVSEGEANGQQAMDNHLAEDRAVEARAATRTNQTNVDITGAVAAAANDAYQKGFKDAERKAADVAAGLRDGSVRLRREWAGCETQRLSDAAAAHTAAEQYARDREDGAGRAVRAAAQCDAQVTGLQRAYNGAKDLLDKHNMDSSRR